jgi:hypothetical protein
LFGSKIIYEYPFMAFSGFHSTNPEGAFSITDELSYIGSWKGLRPQAGAGMHKTEKAIYDFEERKKSWRARTGILTSGRLRWAAIKVV